MTDTVQLLKFYPFFSLSKCKASAALTEPYGSAPPSKGLSLQQTRFLPNKSYIPNVFSRKLQ